MSALEKAAEMFPLLRGRTGVEALTRTVPVVLRFYCGPLRVLTYRTKAKCSLRGNTALIGTHPIVIPYDSIGDTVTSATIAVDYPFIERIEGRLETGTFELGRCGDITLEPNNIDRCLMSLDVDDSSQ